MVHRNARLSELGRLLLARCVVEDGWSLRRAAERFQVSATTAARWAGRALSGLVRQIAPEADVAAADSRAALEAYAAARPQLLSA